MSLRSSVLIFDSSFKPDNIYGADTAHTLSDFRHKVEKEDYSVVVLNLQNLAQPDNLVLLKRLYESDTQFVLLSKNTDSNFIRQASNTLQAFKILSNYNEQQLQRTIQEALEAYGLRKQNDQLFKLFKEQNEKLQKLSKELEQKVQKRQKYLETSRNKLLKINQDIKTLLSALVAIQRSQSIQEIEKNLAQALTPEFPLSWIRITFDTQTNLHHSEKLKLQEFSNFSKDLILEDRTLGKVTFAYPKNKNFTEEEIEFLTKVSNALSLAMDRLLQLENLEQLKSQWDATFDAIVDPVAIIQSNYEITQYNKAFKNFAQFPTENQKNYCYQVLFNRSLPCDNCSLGKTFTLPNTKTQSGNEVHFEVISQPLQEDSSEKQFVNMYRDITVRERFERQLLESSKLAELGTIGGSIAHELNNPLAGLITFVQIIKSELNGDESYYDDIIEIDAAANKCKEIIQNLLSFTRKSDESEKKLFNVSEAVEEAVKILNLKAKSLGIQIHLDIKNHTLNLEGFKNTFTQGLVNLLQNSLEALAEKRKKDKNFQPVIEVLLHKEDLYYLDIVDNGIGLTPDTTLKAFTPFFTTKSKDQHRGLGLTMAYQIFQDHKLSLELTKLSDSRTRARISFPSSF